MMSTEEAQSCPSLFIFIGDESFRVREAEEAAVTRALEGESPGFNLSRFGADAADGALDQARTQPMLARRKVVVIRQMEKATVALLDALMDYAERPNPSTVLILCGAKLPGPVGGVDRGRRLFNRFKAGGVAQRFRSRDQKPAVFVEELCQELGAPMAYGCASLLVQMVGTDLGQLRNEVLKLVNYVGGRGAVERADIEAVCSLVAEAVVWELTDAIVQRDPDRGLCAAYRMLEVSGGGSQATHRLLALITWQVRQLLKLQSSIRSGGELPSDWQRVPRRKLETARRMLRERPMDPARILSAISDANHQLNRSRAGSQRVFEGLVLQLTAR